MWLRVFRACRYKFLGGSRLKDEVALSASGYHGPSPLRCRLAYCCMSTVSQSSLLRLFLRPRALVGKLVLN